MKTGFGAEYHLAGRVDRICKYVMPVRVVADGGSKRRRAQYANVVADIGARVEHLDIAMAGKRGDANVAVKLVRDHDLNPTIASYYGSARAREIEASLDPQCLSGFRKNASYVIEHSAIILMTDNGDFVSLDCAEALTEVRASVKKVNNLPD